MTGFMVHVDRTSIDRSRRGTIGGRCWVSLGACEFPEANWSDLPVAFVRSLFQGLDATQQRAGAAVVPFLDGPFELRLTEHDATAISVAGFERDKRVASVIVDRMEVTDCVARVARDLIDLAATRRWLEDLDVQALRVRLERMP